MSNANFQTAADVFVDWRRDLLIGKSPTLYRCGSGALGDIEIGPGLVTLIGGGPGAGKTALTMQLAVDALFLNESLRVLACNIEMPPTVLLDRQLARLSGIPADDIRYRRLDGHAGQLDAGLAALEEIIDRFCFVRPPFDLANVAESADEFHANLLVLDYIQRIPPPGTQLDSRKSIDASMGYLRQFADAGCAVVVVAAVARQRDSKGRASYQDVTLASFRESSELEFGADDAFIIAPDPKSQNIVTLKHLKSRHGRPTTLTLEFDGALQEFTHADFEAIVL